MSVPSSITRPVSGFSNPPSILSNVVLPEPEDPQAKLHYLSLIHI